MMSPEREHGAPARRGGRLRRLWDAWRWIRAHQLVVAHIVLIGAALTYSLTAGLSPSPHRDTSAACALVKHDDDLGHLAMKPKAVLAEAQLQRWKDCDPGTVDRARHAVDKDWVLIALLGSLFVLSAVNSGRHFRWRLAAVSSGALAFVYIASDLLENVYLRRLLLHGHWSRWLPIYAALKVGAFWGAVPIVIVSTITAITGKPSHDKTPWLARQKQRWRSYRARQVRRRTDDIRVGAAAQPLSPVEPPAGLGICCSGGGIRSAAFTLGAFQALDDPSLGASEYARAKYVTAVSGGSYLAAGWASARAHGREQSWLRHSPEENHLRHNSSYLAPGALGKIWALARFVFGFVLNIGLLVLFFGVVFLPFGWYVSRYEQPRSLQGAGTIQLPGGGCLQRPDGSIVVLLPGTTLPQTDGSVQLDKAAPPQSPSSQSSSSDSARVDVSVDGKPVASAQASGANASASAAASGRSASSSTDDSTGTGSGTAPTSGPTKASCPPRVTPATLLTTRVRAAATDRRLKAGTTLQLTLKHPIQVRGSGIVGCENLTAAHASRCDRSKATIIEARSGTRLVQAPLVDLVLGRDAIVTENNTLAAPCGTHACDNASRPQGVTRAIEGLLALTLLAGLCYVAVRPGPNWSRRIERALRWLVSVGLGAFALLWVFPMLVVATENGRWALEDRFTTTFGIGGFAVIATVFAQIAPLLGTSNKESTSGKVVAFLKQQGLTVRTLLTRLVAIVVGPLIVLAVALAFASFAAQRGSTANQIGLCIALFGPLVTLLSGADLNQWSLHPFYRERLQFAFGFDPTEPYPPEVELGELAVEGQPELIICAAANLDDRRMTAPGRPVASWFFTPNQMGCDAIAAVTGSAYGSTHSPAALPQRLSNLRSLWTAVAVSGAAFSPLMGKMTKPERMVFALANLRLGVWYPNPSRIADPEQLPYYRSHHPRPWYLLKEAFGSARGTDQWIYVTDGGHYENLGLVELLRRRCQQIYCFDASGDTTDTFGTIADAMRLAREELDVEIEIDPSPMKADATGISSFGVTAATINYVDGTQGFLVIAKLTVPKHAPFDIVDLARTLPAFPNNATSDQLYTDQKFEAYRALGHYLGCEARTLASKIAADTTGTVGDAVTAALAVRQNE